MTPEKFAAICCRYLDVFGSSLRSYVNLPRLAVVRTPEGNHYIKSTVVSLSVSTAGYGTVILPPHIYFLELGCKKPSTWLPDEAEKLLPYIKKGLVLELLGGV